MTDLPAPEVDIATTNRWSTVCKDCRSKRAAEQLGLEPRRSKTGFEREDFEYSDDWARRALERGGSRSDRCPECRKTHKRQIAAFPVAYIDIRTLRPAVVDDPAVGPTGPLGSLGPLPDRHSLKEAHIDLQQFEGVSLKRQDILDLIEKMAQSQVVILEAGTGTGKSTLAPFRLMNPPEKAVYRPTDFGPIIVTEPRVPATTEVARFVGESMCFGHKPEECSAHIGPGFPVGYQCKGVKNWDDACQLIYVTDGTLINWIKNGDLARFSTVIIDEAHERSENIDTILVLLHQYLPRYPKLRVVIASATIDKRLFEEYFADVATVDHHFVEAPKNEIGYGTPLFAGPSLLPDDDSHDRLLASGLVMSAASGETIIAFPGWIEDPTTKTDQYNLRAETAKLLQLRWTEDPPADMPKACAQQAFRLLEQIVAGTIPPGDILVFLTTKTTVTDAQAELDERLRRLRWPVNTHWLMKDTPDAAKTKAMASCRPGRFKVVFASNLAETSLTIAGIRYVIDSGLICEPAWDPELAASSYPTIEHSQAGVRQRWGRVGRKRLSRKFSQRGYVGLGSVRRRRRSRLWAAHMKPSVTRGSRS